MREASCFTEEAEEHATKVNNAHISGGFNGLVLGGIGQDHTQYRRIGIFQILKANMMIFEEKKDRYLDVKEEDDKDWYQLRFVDTTVTIV
jgi:hypothetical protein